MIHHVPTYVHDLRTMSDKSERMLTMKRMNTRLLAMLLALVLVFTSLPATAVAATTGASDDHWG